MIYPKAATMYRSKDIERWGSGIKRIHDECAVAGVKVEFKRFKTGFAVVFYWSKWEESEGIKTGGQIKTTILSNRQKKILEILKKKPMISRKELAERNLSSM